MQINVVTTAVVPKAPAVQAAQQSPSLSAPKATRHTALKVALRPCHVVGLSWAPAARAGAARLETLRPSCQKKDDESGRISAAEWVDNWVARTEAAKKEPPAPSPFQKQYEEALSFDYVYCHDFVSSPNDFRGIYLKDCFAAVGVDMLIPDLRIEGSDHYSLSSALEALHDFVQGRGKQVRLIGSRVGGQLAALYAEKYPGSVDNLFLIEPVFDMPDALELLVGGPEPFAAWQSTGHRDFDGVQVPYEVVEDTLKHSDYPFVTCGAYVVSPHTAEELDPEKALRWVRAASIHMRGAGETQELAKERRLLEMGAGYGLEGCMGMVGAKMVDWNDLNLGGGPRSIRGNSMERMTREQYLRDHALDHSHNWDVLAEYEKTLNKDKDQEETQPDK